MARTNGPTKLLLLELTPGRSVVVRDIGALGLYAMLHRLEKATGYTYTMSKESHTITCQVGKEDTMAKAPTKKPVKKVKKPVKKVKKPAMKKKC